MTSVAHNCCSHFRPDPQRIEAVGPDKAAAEWLLRNGASVKWTGSQEWLKDYDLLPKEGMNKQLKIKEIDATDSSISHIGFPHLSISSLFLPMPKILFNWCSMCRWFDSITENGYRK